MHTTINVRFTVSIGEGKTIPLAAAAEFITDQNVESVLVDALVESLGAARVEALCGEKHVTGNGNNRFQHAGTDTRAAVTTAGEHAFIFTTSKILILTTREESPSKTVYDYLVKRAGSEPVHRSRPVETASF